MHMTAMHRGAFAVIGCDVHEARAHRRLPSESMPAFACTYACTCAWGCSWGCAWVSGWVCVHTRMCACKYARECECECGCGCAGLVCVCLHILPPMCVYLYTHYSLRRACCTSLIPYSQHVYVCSTTIYIPLSLSHTHTHTHIRTLAADFCALLHKSHFEARIARL